MGPVEISGEHAVQRLGPAGGKWGRRALRHLLYFKTRGDEAVKQAEKNKKSREHILSYAFKEFAAQGYQGASVNAICANGRISKGLLYHYYADKDALYLACVERCFRELTEYLSGHLEEETVTPDQYFDTRLQFFREHSCHQRLFCDAVINPQSHLKEALSVCRKAFDALNESMLTAILRKERLADGVSVSDAVRQLQLLADFTSTYLKNSEQGGCQLEEHERLCRQVLHTMLYGLIAHQ